MNARLASPSAVSSAIARSAAPSAAPTAKSAAAADASDSDDGLELVGEQTLDEVLAVCGQIARKAMPAHKTISVDNLQLGCSKYMPVYELARCAAVGHDCCSLCISVLAKSHSVPGFGFAC